jgi:peptidyl-prolyl cis-trans isomerase B (cyclophilin B)
VASSKTRQRKLARAKMERQMARRAAKLRQRRQRLALGIVGLVVVLGAVGTVWALGGFAKSKKAPTATSCTWTDAGTANDQLKDVGKPPTTGHPRTGTQPMTITTNLGTISATVDLAKSPCTAASFSYLAGKSFFANTKCHRLNPAQFLLQCGDPTGTGQGGPRYTYANEYVPTTPAPKPSSPSPSPSASDEGEGATDVIYPAGSVATANQAADANGSQFYILYQDSPLPPNYTLFGQVTAGLDIVKQVAAAGDDGAFANQGGGGHPKKEITIQTLVMGTTPTSSPSPSRSPSPSGSPSAKS